MIPDSPAAIVAYHERTKHHYHRYAASLGYMDWATQPDPFRRYQGAPLIELPLAVMPLAGAAGRLSYLELYSPGAAPAPLTLESLSLFFRLSLSITAWKSLGGTSWALRANPSSGNLHPTEGYAILPALEALGSAPGLYHYAPLEHALEARARLDAPERGDAVLARGFCVGLSSIHWREAWKYGERAFRYCRHDAGHALAAMRIAAAALGWRLRLAGDAPYAIVARCLGLDRDADFEGGGAPAEREEPELLAWVATGPEEAAGHDGAGRGDLMDLTGLANRMAAAAWFGRANRLSAAHAAEWPVIEEAALATRRPEAGPALAEPFDGLPEERDLPLPRAPRLGAEEAILRRRSAVDMDGQTSITKDAFFAMLARLIPTTGNRALPWDAIPWRPRVHLALFVHRVRGLAPGLYALVRDPERTAELRAAMRAEFRWERVPGTPPGVHLHLLAEGDAREAAAALSCGQEIAANGAFSLGMIAEFERSLETRGAAFYRNLFWEAGMVGQVLYLEAEEAGLRATGIGCYYDDPVHEILGLGGRAWQSLYHFTVGGPVEDERLTTRPGYERDRP